MTAPKPLPSQEQLRALFDYNEHTGYLTWRRRDDVPGCTNSRFASKRAGAPSGRGWSVMVDHRQLRYHRVIWKWVHDTEPPEIDHINGNSFDNRLVNLRASNRWLNAKNRGPTVGKSLPKGVTLQKGCKRYNASIRRDGQTRIIGYFVTPEAAHAAYKIAAQELFGEWARDTAPISDELREMTETDRNRLKRDPMSAEQRVKISAALIGQKRGPHSPEHRAKIGTAQRGIKRGPQSAEHIEKCRQTRIGKKKPPLTPEQRAAISARQLGKKRGPHLASTRAAMVAAWVRRRAASADVGGS